MTCGELRSRLNAVREGSLGDADLVAVRNHLACCEECRGLTAVRTPYEPGTRLRLATPLLLVGALTIGALVLARCGGGGDQTAEAPGGDGTQVAKADGGSGAVRADGEATQQGPSGQTAAPTAGAVTSAPIGKVQDPPPPVTPTAANMAKKPVGPKDVGEPPAAPTPGASPKAEPIDPAKWPESPSTVVPNQPEVPLPAMPTAPAPPTPSGAPPGVTPPAPRPTEGPGATPTPAAPDRPTGTATVERPGDVTSPAVPEPGEQPTHTAGRESTDPEQVRLMAALLADPDRSLGERVRAARVLGEAGGAEAAEALLQAITTEPSLRLREAAAEALGALGGSHGQSALRRALEAQPAGSLELIAVLAESLRRVGVLSYLQARMLGDLNDFSPRVRARGALGAGRGELIALGDRLVELLDDHAVIGTGSPNLAGRAIPGLKGDRVTLEVRHAAWRGLTMLAGEGDFGFDRAAWTRFLTRRRSELGAAAPTAPPPPTPPGLGTGEATALLERLPALPMALGSRDPKVLDDVLFRVRTTLDFPAVAAGPTDPVGTLVRGLPKFGTAAERDAFCAHLYVEAIQRRPPGPLSALLGLVSAGKAGRQAWISRMGAGGVATFVAALRASLADPGSQYAEGGALLRLLDGFRPGADPDRACCERGSKGLDAQAVDAEAFARAVAETGAWWDGLSGGPAWNAATGTIGPAIK